MKKLVMVMTLALMGCNQTASYSYIVGPEKTNYPNAVAYCHGLGAEISNIASDQDFDALVTACSGQCWITVGDDLYRLDQDGYMEPETLGDPVLDQAYPLCSLKH